MFCQKCGTETNDGDQFCQKCGHKLGESISKDNIASGTGKHNEEVTGKTYSPATKKKWFQYTPWKDDSIEMMDKILFSIYVMGTLFVPVTLFISLIVIYFVRKDKVHDISHSTMVILWSIQASL